MGEKMRNIIMIRIYTAKFQPYGDAQSNYEIIYKGEKGFKWYTKRRYFYLYDNETDFEKYLNNYLEHLKEWNKEYEEEIEADVY